MEISEVHCSDNPPALCGPVISLSVVHDWMSAERSWILLPAPVSEIIPAPPEWPVVEHSKNETRVKLAIASTALEVK